MTKTVMNHLHRLLLFRVTMLLNHILYNIYRWIH